MIKRIALASLFVGVLAVGMGTSTSASADHCHHHGVGYHASYSVYGPSVAVVHTATPYSAYYAPARVRPIRPLRAFAAPIPVPAPVYPTSASFRISLNF